MAAELEKRAAALASCGAAANGRHLEGYASVFNASTDLGAYTETVSPQAFDRTLEAVAAGTADVVLCLDHDRHKILGRTRSGTLKLSKDSHGLKVACELPGTSLGADVAELVRRQDCYGMSFAFRCAKDSWENGRRTLLDVDLVDVSVLTTEPAYGQTSVSVRHSQTGKKKDYYYAFTL